MPRTQPKAKVSTSSKKPSPGPKPSPGGKPASAPEKKTVSAKAGKPQSSRSSTAKKAPSRAGSSQSGRNALIKRYEAAVSLLHRQQFKQAKKAFEKVINTDDQDQEICERALTYIRLCDKKMVRSHPVPKNLEELYNLGITLINNGRYEDSIRHLNRALKENPKCDYVIYALAVCDCWLENRDRALKHLKLAIDLKVENRFLAQRDADFEPIMGDPQFVALVFPEAPPAATS